MNVNQALNILKENNILVEAKAVTNIKERLSQINAQKAEHIVDAYKDCDGYWVNFDYKVYCYGDEGCHTIREDVWKDVVKAYRKECVFNPNAKRGFDDAEDATVKPAEPTEEEKIEQFFWKVKQTYECRLGFVGENYEKEILNVFHDKFVELYKSGLDGAKAAEKVYWMWRRIHYPEEF